MLIIILAMCELDAIGFSRANLSAPLSDADCSPSGASTQGSEPAQRRALRRSNGAPHLRTACKQANKHFFANPVCLEEHRFNNKMIELKSLRVDRSTLASDSSDLRCDLTTSLRPLHQLPLTLAATSPKARECSSIVWLLQRPAG